MLPPTRTRNPALQLAGQTIQPGTRSQLNLELPTLYTHTSTTLPIHVIHGRRSGPTLFVSAAVHGDELNGIEIIRRLLSHKTLARVSGTLILIPMVNIYGVIHHSRYLPDRRDLNRSFPGSTSGSLAARLANLLLTEIVEKCTHGIDLHTAAIHRSNLPQIRANLDDEKTLSMAQAFKVPVLINADLRDGSLRAAANELHIPMLVYEAGEALRFDEISIRAGVRGVMNVMRFLKMLPKTKSRQTTPAEPYIARSSSWLRAESSGIFRSTKPLGELVNKGDLLGDITDPVNLQTIEIVAPAKGLIIGRSELPLVYEGDALFHLAKFHDPQQVGDDVESFQESISNLENQQSLQII
ncbi:MAG: succinylglutamate desuccinylase/aspartoacylase family protein [Gammaproteobacteria bacterium]|nr:succinylglutamate desuccinylase/aspartoacylase family protein [Gammaproteobacteria bacterium]